MGCQPAPFSECNSSSGVAEGRVEPSIRGAWYEPPMREIERLRALPKTPSKNLCGFEKAPSRATAKTALPKNNTMAMVDTTLLTDLCFGA